MTEVRPVITFDRSASVLVLDMLDKAVDEEGFIVEKSNRSQRVISSDGNEITVDEFAGVKRGSIVFIENNVVSLMKLSKE